DCEDIRNELHFKLPTYSLDIFHGTLKSEEKENILKKWENNKIQVIIATTAFGIGLDTSDVRLVLHYTFPINLIELIQQSGRAGHNGKQAQDIVFFSMRDLRTNYCIITGNQESNNEINSIDVTFENYLRES
ncbi:2890_t:CDS:2, partial [Scutellospora calospora]